MPHFDLMRYNMVQGQLRPEGVKDPRILSAFSDIPREKFVPRQCARIAYMDADVPLEKERVLLRPATLARLLQACQIEEAYTILYVGCGVGYGPAILSHMGINVVALDSEMMFTQKTQRYLKDLSLTSVEVALGPLDEGWSARAPYDRIIIEGAFDEPPPCFVSQLKIRGEIIGLTVAPPSCQKAIKYIKTKILLKESLFYATGPQLPGFKNKEVSVFSGKETDFVYGKD